MRYTFKYECIIDTETKGARPNTAHRLIDVVKKRSYLSLTSAFLLLYGSPNKPQCDDRDVKGQEAIFGLPDLDENRSWSWRTIQRTRDK